MNCYSKILRFNNLIAVIFASILLTSRAHSQTNLVVQNENCSINVEQNECLIEAKQFTRNQPSGKWTIVDTRNESGYKRIRIPGSINLPLFSIKFKDFFKDEHLLLIGAPLNEPELLRVCGDLKRKGFKSVQVLSGGLLAWESARLPLSGDKNWIQDLKLLKVQDFLLGLGEVGLLVVNSSNLPNELLGIVNRAPQVRMIRIPFSDIDTYMESVRRNALKVSKGRFPVILLLPQTDEALERQLLSATSRFTSAHGIYILKGGKQALDNYLQQNENFILAKQQSLKQSSCR